MRSIYHRTDDRVQAHIYVATLAFVIHRALEKKLKAAGLDISATEALNALKCVRVVDFSLGDSATKRSVTRPTQRAAATHPTAAQRNRDVETIPVSTLGKTRA
jgi:hypothetical protein